jgi:hypothetical protein
MIHDLDIDLFNGALSRLTWFAISYAVARG